MQPVIIELAVNGETPKTRNHNVPRLPAEIATQAIAAIGGGAAIIHNHIDDFRLTGAIAAARYAEGWAAILARHADAILCPTNAGGATDRDKIAHFKACADYGARMAPIDPGSMNLPITGGELGDTQVATVSCGLDRIDTIFTTIAAAGLAASIGVYEPGYLRAAVAYQRAGRMPPGSIAKFYFCGGAAYADGRPGIGFGLDPSSAALEAYLEIIGDSGLAWSAAVVGGDLFESGMAQLAIARGGHLRLGLEDHAGDRTPTNATLLAEVVSLCREAGRPPAAPSEAAAILGLP